MTPSKFPTSISINAWTGTQAGQGSLNRSGAVQWGVRAQVDEIPRYLYAPAHLDLRKWDDPEVGWGVVLADDDGRSVAERAIGVDAPEAIRQLLAVRNDAPIYRYRRELNNRYLRRYFPDGASQDVQISSAGLRGVGKGRLPHYLLIYGSPRQVPWRLQYALNQPCFVGRLDLDGAALQRYVDQLVGAWSQARAKANSPVVWATDHGPNDITSLMRRAIAEPVAERLRANDYIRDNLRVLTADQATALNLINTLAQANPALVVSTSHGMTAPLNDKAKMAEQLGLLVDSQGLPVLSDALLAAWQPDGAIWYAHACCSAGSDERNSYAGLVRANSTAGRILKAVGELGERIAPFPQSLLGAEKPLRAFVGHVEPTFDWTLRDPNTGQRLTETIRRALYNHLYQREPETIGMALHACYRHVGELLAQWTDALNELNRMDATPSERESAENMALQVQLTALDRRSMVILGDPAVTLPPL